MVQDRAISFLDTGVPEIDSGKEGLNYLLTKIFDSGVECRGLESRCDYSRCDKISAIVAYLNRIFVAEEALMQGAGYPHRGAHRRDHAQLLDELNAFQAAKLCGERHRLTVRQAIDRWTVRHHYACDEPLARWSNGKA